MTFVLWLDEEENECVSEASGVRRAVNRAEREREREKERDESAFLFRT